MLEDREYGVSVTVRCECGEEIACSFFSIDSDRSVDVTASRCKKCRIDAVDVGYTEGYQRGEVEGYNKGSQDGYDDGYEAGCESNIKFVDDDESTK